MTYIVVPIFSLFQSLYGSVETVPFEVKDAFMVQFQSLYGSVKTGLNERDAVAVHSFQSLYGSVETLLYW